MAFLEDIIAQLVDNAGLTRTDRSVESLVSALFHGSDHGAGIGGLQGLIKRFDDAGLGYIIHSWTGPGPKLPVTPDQLRAVLSDNLLKSIAAASTREEHDILLELSLLLPGVVERVTHPTKD